MTAPRTVFDAIIAGHSPASFVLKDAHCVAFLDINPLSRGHVLVVPRQSVATLAELDPLTRGQLWETAQRIALAQQRALGSIAQHFLVNDGRGANQSVPQVHLHVIPRYADDRWRTALRMAWHIATLSLPRPERLLPRSTLDATAAALSAALPPA